MGILVGIDEDVYEADSDFDEITELVTKLDLTNNDCFLDFQAWKKFDGGVETLKIIVEKYQH